MAIRWLGRPWSQVREELEKESLPYSLNTTCAPGREPYGDDVRVVQVQPQDDGVCITVCAFRTKVTG